MIGYFLFLAALAANPTGTFNLICNGSQVSRTGNQMSKPLPFNTTFRIDLNRSRWCVGKCTSTKPLHAVTEAEIVFDEWKDGDFGYSSKVNRETGVYSEAIWGDGSRGYIEAMCERAPFTGHPKKQF